MEVQLPSIEDILRIQSRVLRRDGGLAGVRDLGLLTSAAMMPQQTYDGRYVHEDLAAMAAAYLFHLAKNHAFLDGNKRVALATALVFLKRNGVTRLPDQDDAADVTIRVASGEMTKDQLTSWFRGMIGEQSASG